MPLSSHNSLPFQVGGGPTRFEATYTAIQRMVGTNGYSTDDDEIESLWRQAKADALAALGTFDERAALQASPETATDHIPLYEEMLGIVADTSLSDEQRRNIIVPDYTGVPEAWTLGLNDQLHRIDASANVLPRPWLNSGACQIGRWYQTFAVGVDPYDPSGSRIATSYPNVSDMYSVIIHYDIGNYSAPNREHQRKASQMIAELCDVCPAWVDIRLIYSIGFSLDRSRLDATGFGI